MLFRIIVFYLCALSKFFLSVVFLTLNFFTYACAYHMHKRSYAPGPGSMKAD